MAASCSRVMASSGGNMKGLLAIWRLTIITQETPIKFGHGEVMRSLGSIAVETPIGRITSLDTAPSHHSPQRVPQGSNSPSKSPTSARSTILSPAESSALSSTTRPHMGLIVSFVPAWYGTSRAETSSRTRNPVS
ncbi:hypothetical protein G6O67_001029 [Ophiocordyceps sinensis]|uniref:Uncharacterized protein n=1 Tax=Ophiocordyceps sinensis TaxID=72228 RepID=A0A8H4V8N5_9HYPO|nr:hypothetical protein G6O67_001029 [Ophiocordyceps sinensis]